MKAREAAFRVVHGVLYKKEYSNIALEQILGNEGFSGQDAGFITEIVLGTLRNKLYLEYIISNYSNMKINKISPSAMSAMLTGAYQILFMDRTPDSAACNESVKIASKFAGQRVRGFVNAVLRAISREKQSNDELLNKLSGLKKLSVRYSCSMEAVKKLADQYGLEKTSELLENMNKPAVTCIRFNSTDNEKAEKLLEAEGIDYTKGELAAGAYYPSLGRPVASLKLYKDGILTIQDEGAQVMGEFTDPKPNSSVLDTCASPGGKTIHMASLMKSKGEITACDIHHHRVENMKENFIRTNYDFIESVKMDMSEYNAEFDSRYDTVLVDAPCSGIGTAQRRPEIKLFYKEDAGLYRLQEKILANCARYVKPGGQLIYGTCTLFSEENKNAVEKLLKTNTEFNLIDEKTILPDGKTGGFYMAKMVKA